LNPWAKPSCIYICLQPIWCGYFMTGWQKTQLQIPSQS